MSLKSIENKEIHDKRPKVEPIPVPDVPSLAPFLAKPEFTEEDLQNLSSESSESAWREFLSTLGIEIKSGSIVEKRDNELGAFLVEITLDNGEQEKCVKLYISIGKDWLEIEAGSGGLIPESMLEKIDPTLKAYKSVERVRLGLNGSISLLGNPSSLASVGQYSGAGKLQIEPGRFFVSRHQTAFVVENLSRIDSHLRNINWVDYLRVDHGGTFLQFCEPQDGANLTHVDSRLAGISRFQALGFQDGDLVLSAGLVGNQALTGLATLVPQIESMCNIRDFRVNASGRIKGLRFSVGALEGLNALDSKIPSDAGIDAIRWNDQGEIVTVSFVSAATDRHSSCMLEICQALFGADFVIPEGINAKEIMGVIRCPDGDVPQRDLSFGFYNIYGRLVDGALSSRFLFSVNVGEFKEAESVNTEDFLAKPTVESLLNKYQDAVKVFIGSVLTETGKTFTR